MCVSQGEQFPIALHFANDAALRGEEKQSYSREYMHISRVRLQAKADQSVLIESKP